jgi:hypothetical protein
MSPLGAVRESDDISLWQARPKLQWLRILFELWFVYDTDSGIVNAAGATLMTLRKTSEDDIILNGVRNVSVAGTRGQGIDGDIGASRVDLEEQPDLAQDSRGTVDLGIDTIGSFDGSVHIIHVGG